jgi:hypothetical protein
MQKFVLDTGAILGYIRAAGYAYYIEKKYAPFTPPNIALISVVSKGEIYSLAKQFGWGAGKLKTLDELLRKLPTVDISHDQVIQRYSEIDAFSLAKTRRDRFQAVKRPASWGRMIYGSPQRPQS